MDYTDEHGLMSPFYRVTVRALVRDPEQNVLVLENSYGEAEIPGGGWEHHETLEQSIRREVKEELGVEVKSIGDIWFVYRGASEEWKSMVVRLVVPVELASHDFNFTGDDIRSARFMGKEECIHQNWTTEDREILEHLDKLWPPVEK